VRECQDSWLIEKLGNVPHIFLHQDEYDSSLVHDDESNFQISSGLAGLFFRAVG